MKQIVLKNDNYKSLDKYFLDNDIKDIFIVCTKSFDKLDIGNHLKNIENLNITIFRDFTPNPDYEDVVKGVKKFKESECRFILAVGGGSAIDVAKCIKLFSNMDEKENYLNQEHVKNDIILLAIPTTSGTGSESTKFAVIYYNGEKQSISDESIIPSVILLDSKSISSLPIFQKKVTMLDALSHSIESYWSMNSTPESEEYSLKALNLILDNMDAYLENNTSANENMLIASNIAGKAINITQTTAGHAMCYKLTSLYNIPHGEACGFINSILLPYMLDNYNDFGKKIKNEKLKQKLDNLVTILSSKNYLIDLLGKLELYNFKIKEEDIDLLTSSVNIVRLKNHPIEFDKDDIKKMYITLYNKLERNNNNGS